MLLYPLMINFILGLSKNTKIERKLTKYVLLCTYYYKLILQKSYKPNTTIIYIKMTNNDDIKQL